MFIDAVKLEIHIHTHLAQGLPEGLFAAGKDVCGEMAVPCSE